MSIRRTVIGVGYISKGIYKSRLDGDMTHEYISWRDMIHRCYNPRLIDKYPTYSECEVCDEWHDFQNFAKWSDDSNFSGLGYHVDKDLLVQGNKVYSPENCCLLPPELNFLIRIHSPNPTCLVGTTFHKRCGKWQSMISKNGKRVYLGMFNNEMDAHLCYVEEKERFVREEAQLWRERIDPRAYDALMRWRVNP